MLTSGETTTTSTFEAPAGQASRPLPLAEEAYRLATEHGLVALAQQSQRILNRIRSQAR